MCEKAGAINGWAAIKSPTEAQRQPLDFGNGNYCGL